MRYEGTDSALIVNFGNLAEMIKAFEAAYRMRYSFLMPGHALIAEAVSVEAIGSSDTPDEVAGGDSIAQPEEKIVTTVSMHTGDRSNATPVRRERCCGERSTARRSSRC